MEEDSILKVFAKSGFLKKEEILSICRKEKLFSRKNDVYKVEVESKTGIKPYLLKQFKGDNRYSRIKKELYFYKLLSNDGLKVPRIYYSDRDMMVMEFMGDRTLLDHIIQEEKNARDQNIDGRSGLMQIAPLIADTLDYINSFNKKLKKLTGLSYVLGDMNHRNFLLPEGQVCRVDLEDCREGAAEEDVGKFIAFFLTYDPSHTAWKRSMSVAMKSYCEDNMDLGVARIEREIGTELGKMAQRRR